MFSVKRNLICCLVCLSLLLVLALPFPAAMAKLNALDASLIPEDAIALAISPANGNQPRIIYAIYGITKDGDMLSVSVRQISTDPQRTIYKEDVVNVDEQDIRQMSAFTKDQPIIGSYCEMHIEKAPDGEKYSDRWSYPTNGEIFSHGYYMDETIFFPLAELGDNHENLTLRMGYNCISVPGTLDEHPLCLMTIQLSDYLKPACSADLRTLDVSRLPKDTIAVVASSLDRDHPGVAYAIHGIAQDEETLAASVMQLAMEPQWKIYDADTDGVTEEEIRWVYGYAKERPILGSYCEGYMKSLDEHKDQWSYCKQDSSMPCGNDMDERFLFLLSEIADEKNLFQMVYNCIPVAGEIADTPHCLMSIDVSDYLN